MGAKLNYPSLIKESVEELTDILKGETNSLHRDRVRFILYLKQGEMSQSAAAKSIQIKIRQGQRNWEIYKKKGLSGLLKKREGGAPCKLNDKQLAELEIRLKDDDIQFLHQAQKYVEQTYQKSYTLPGLHYLFKRLKVKKNGTPQ